MTGLLYNHYNLSDQWLDYNDVVSNMIELGFFILIFFDYLMLKYDEQVENVEAINIKNTKILTKLVGVKVILVFCFALMFIKMVMEVLLGSFLFNAYM